MAEKLRYRLKGEKEYREADKRDDIPDDAIDMHPVGEPDYNEMEMTKKDHDRQRRKKKWRRQWSKFKSAIDYVLKLLKAIAAVIAAIASIIVALR